MVGFSDKVRTTLLLGRDRWAGCSPNASLIAGLANPDFLVEIKALAATGD